MKRQGFTLIEMLVVIAIIGICVALTIPYFVEAQRGAALRTSAQTIIQTAKYARSMALLKQTDFALLVDKGASQFDNLRRHRCREQQGLPFLGKRRNDERARIGNGMDGV